MFEATEISIQSILNFYSENIITETDLKSLNKN